MTKNRSDSPSSGRVQAAVFVGATTTVVALAVAGMFGAWARYSPSLEFPDQVASEPKPSAPSGRTVDASVVVPAQTVIDAIMERDPESLRGLGASRRAGGTPDSPFAWVCPSENDGNRAAPTLSDQRAFAQNESSWVTVTVQAYGAGQGTESTQAYRDAVNDCSGSRGYVSNSNVGFDAPSGFKGSFVSGRDRMLASTWNQGDILISVAGTNQELVNRAAAEYNRYLLEVLTPVCPVLTPTEEDMTRSPYINAEAYTGWQRGRDVNLSPISAGIAPGVLSNNAAITGTGTPVGNVPAQIKVPEGNPIPGPDLEVADVDIPEKPLEPVTPSSLPDEVDEPGDAPETPRAPSTSTVVPERVEDVEGPGCGWAFTGQRAPLFDDTVEKERADALAAAAHEDLRNAQVKYRQDRSQYLVSYADYAYRVSQYNIYAEQVNEISDIWEDINDKRAVYREELDEYYDDLEDREDFFERQEEAQERYDDALEQCIIQDAAREAFEDEQDRLEAIREERFEEDAQAAAEATPAPSPTETSAPVATPTPTYTPAPRPTFDATYDCPAPRPNILDQAPPSVPSPPAKPDVPLPYAWDDVPD